MASERALEREAYWRGVIRDQQASKDSVAAFCRARKITTASFYSWRRRLGAPQPESASKGAEFVAIEVAGAPWSATQGGFEVVLKNGRRVVVPAVFDVHALRQLLGVLEESAC